MAGTKNVNIEGVKDGWAITVDATGGECTVPENTTQLVTNDSPDTHAYLSFVSLLDVVVGAVPPPLAVAEQARSPIAPFGRSIELKIPRDVTKVYWKTSTGLTAAVRGNTIRYGNVEKTS